MICTATNAYPNQHCIDTNNRTQFKFSFYGDHCMGADFWIYDAFTGEHLTYTNGGTTYDYRMDRKTGGYESGEEIGVNYQNDYYKNGNDYYWRARILESIDFNFGKEPSVLVSSGLIVKNPIIVTSVQSFPTSVDDIFIPIETGLDIELPCYCYLENYGYKNVVSYDKYSGIIKLSSAFSAIPEEGDEIIISKYKTNSLPDDTKAYVCVEPNNDLITADKYKLTSTSQELPCCYIKIGSSWRAINKYTKKTGILYIETAFADEVPVGTEYKIYCNYKWTPPFYFKTKATPVVSPLMIFTNECIKCTASTTNMFYSIKYYYWEIYLNNNLVERSEKIYSGSLEYLCRNIRSGFNYTGKITIVTQDGVEFTSSSAACSIPSGGAGISNLTASIDKNKNAVHLSWTNNANCTSYIITRQGAGDVTTEYLETLLDTSTDYYDYKAANNDGYVYNIVPKSVSTVYTTSQAVALTEYDGWTLYFLEEKPYTRPSKTITDIRIFYEYMYGEKQYNVSSVWKINLNIEPSDIKHNISRDVQIGYSGKPIIINGGNDYDTFSLKFMLADLSCSTEDFTGYSQSTFETFKQYISSASPVLLKDTKGNVWFGNITAHSYKSDDSWLNYSPYDITLEFTQTRDILKTRILSS